jgi:hypothetical protein
LNVVVKVKHSIISARVLEEEREKKDEVH